MVALFVRVVLVVLVGWEVLVVWVDSVFLGGLGLFRCFGGFGGFGGLGGFGCFGVVLVDWVI